jgi:hypothetical protein
MKKLLLFAGLAAATLSLTNCNKQEIDYTGDAGRFSIHFVAPETKTTNDGLSTNWTKGDNLTVFYAPAGTKNYSENIKFTFADEEAAANGVATGEVELGTGSYDWYAIYPYSSKYSTPENTDCYATLGSSASGSQTQDGLDSKAHLAGYYYPVVGKVTSAASAAPTIKMKQLTTVIAVKVKNTTTAPINVNTVNVTAPKDLVGGFFVNFASETPIIVPEEGYTGKTAKLAVTGDNTIAAGATGTFYLAVCPFSVSNADLTVKIIADEGSVEKTKTITADFLAGHIKTVNVDFDNASGPAEIIKATVKEFLAATVSEDQWYQLTGTVSNIVNTTYGNFDLTDETGTVYVYGLTETKVAKNDKTFSNLGINAGDKVTIISLRSEHNGTAEAGGNTPAYFVSKEAGAASFGVEKNSFSISAETTSVTIKVTGNVAWTAEGSTGTTLDKTSGTGEGSIKVSLDANTDTKAKEYTVFVRTSNTQVADDEIEVNITQAAAAASGGTADNPYTVAEAIAATEALGEGNTASSKCYVKGIVSEIVEISTVHGNGTFYISDNGSTTNQYQVYRSKYVGNTNFTDEGQLAVGDVVIVYGAFKYYKSSTGETTLEFANGWIHELTRGGKKQYALSASATPNSVGASSATVTVNVYGNVDWSASVSGGASLDVTSGSGIGEIKVTIPENTSEQGRTFTVTVSSSAVSSPAVVEIAQSGKVTPGGNGDVLTADDFAATTTTYTDFSGVSKPSGAVYAGQSAKSNSGAIQLRSKNSNSGIVSTKSGGKVKKVTIDVESGSNAIEIYASNTAYTAASDLYATEGNLNQGTKVGSLTASGSVDIDGDYQYIGIRSENGAIYLKSVTIEWK